MEGLELTCFEIISHVGAAKSCYIEAIHKAKEGEFEEAQKLVEEGNKHYAEGHKVHVDMIQKEASGEAIPVSLFVVHAEDQMMNAETFQVLAGEFIDICKRL
jgi:PTS system cellobiose-specific IIA component